MIPATKKIKATVLTILLNCSGTLFCVNILTKSNMETTMGVIIDNKNLKDGNSRAVVL